MCESTEGSAAILLQRATVSVTWQPPGAAALPVVAYRVERVVGAQAQKVAAGRME